MIRAVLVDDEAPARARLRALLDEIGGVHVLAECGGAAEARRAIAATRPDLVFLDVEMPETRGTDLAASLPEPRPFIVFATAYDAFAIEAFQYDAVDYLLKPVTRQRLASTLERIRARLARQSDLERDLADATQVQHHLLPRRLPAVPGYEVGAASLPARGVGGDFHDVLVPDASSAMLVLGDVSGKGMAAGLVASSVQARIQTAVRHGAWTSPVALVDALNGEVSATTDVGRYATLVLARLECATGRVEYVNAGHPAGLVLGADGAVRAELPSTAPAVGLIEGVGFATAEVWLAPGETLVVVSDGVTEALDGDDREFDLAQVGTLAAALVGRPAAALATAVVDAVRAHRGARQGQDDVTVLVTRRRTA
jgi:sigma-B regulation protein RsbU (phosphoserine phosphatase)